MRVADVFRWLTVILLGLALFGLERVPFAQSCSEAAGQPEVCSSLSAVESEGWQTVLLFVLPPLLLALGAAISRNPQFTILASAVIFGLAVLGKMRSPAHPSIVFQWRLARATRFMSTMLVR